MDLVSILCTLAIGEKMHNTIVINTIVSICIHHGIYIYIYIYIYI